MSRSLGGALLLLAIGLLAGCRQQTSNPAILASVGSREIRIEDFKREVEWRVKNNRSLPDKQSLLEEMIARELLVQKARRLGLETDPEVRRSYESLLAGKVQDRELKPRLEALTVQPEELRALYEKNAATQYTRPAKAHLALVCIKIDPKSSPEKVAELEARIQEARQRAKALPPSSRGFDRVAVDYSEDQASRYKGGDVGWFDQGQTGYRWPAEVITAGFDLKNKGDISEVIKTTNGFYIVSKLDSREPVITPLEQVQPSLQRRLLAEKRQQTEAAFRQETRASIAVRAYPQVLAQVAYPAAVAKVQEPLPPALPRSP